MFNPLTKLEYHRIIMTGLWFWTHPEHNPVNYEGYLYRLQEICREVIDENCVKLPLQIDG